MGCDRETLVRPPTVGRGYPSLARHSRAPERRKRQRAQGRLYPRLSGWRAWVHPPQAGKPALHANTNEERSHPSAL